MFWTSNEGITWVLCKFCSRVHWDFYFSYLLICYPAVNFVLLAKGITLPTLYFYLYIRFQKGPTTSFSPVTSTNVGIGPQNFLTFSLTLLPHWCKISSLYLVPIPNYWTLTRATIEKGGFSGQILIKLRLW